MNLPRVDLAVACWAHRTAAIEAALLVGSRAHPPGGPLVAAADDSDWDFQFVVRRPAAFHHPDWVEGLGGGPPRAYVVRKALWGGGFKVNLVLAGADLDVMVLPAQPLRRLHWLSTLGRHRREGPTRHALQLLGYAIRPHWHVLKGEPWLARLYARAATLPDPALSDRAIRQLVAGFGCDHRWVLRKIARGELLAAQRTLHLELAEVNFRLRHALRLRRGQPSFEGARRLEQLAGPAEQAAMAVDARCAPEALAAAAERAALTCRQLAAELLGPPAPGRPDSPFRAIPAPEQQQETA
jgi:hypothetical protein